jgi:hypothetical protein
VRVLLDRLRFPLACIAFGSISVAFCGICLTTPPSSSFPLTASELFGISIPLTVAWFSFSGLCMLANEKTGLSGVVASWSRFAGQAALLAGIPVWVYWYLHLVFRVI